MAKRVICDEITDQIDDLCKFTNIDPIRARELLILSGGDMMLAVSCIRKSFFGTTSIPLDVCRAMIIDARLKKLEDLAVGIK